MNKVTSLVFLPLVLSLIILITNAVGQHYINAGNRKAAAIVKIVFWAIGTVYTLVYLLITYRQIGITDITFTILGDAVLIFEIVTLAVSIYRLIQMKNID